MNLHVPGSSLAAWRIAFPAGACFESEPGGAALLAACLRRGTSSQWHALQRLVELGAAWDISCSWGCLEVSGVGHATDANALGDCLVNLVMHFDPTSADLRMARLDVAARVNESTADAPEAALLNSAVELGSPWPARYCLPRIYEPTASRAEVERMWMRAVSQGFWACLAGPRADDIATTAEMPTPSETWSRPSPPRRDARSRSASVVAVVRAPEYLTAIALRAAAYRALSHHLRDKESLYSIKVETDGQCVVATVASARHSSKSLTASVSRALDKLEPSEMDMRLGLAHELVLMQSTEYWADLCFALGRAPWSPITDPQTLLKHQPSSVAPWALGSS